MRLELPDGQWAELYDPVKVPERKRRPAVRALVTFMASQGATVASAEDLAKLDPAVLDMADELNDAVVVAMVREWSFGAVSAESLLDLPADCYLPLAEECSKHVGALLPNFQVDPDPKAPTGS